ncbi:MAG: hypothetical protein HZB19_07635 [Chloroflexi bacterium]|nr:hypothetical protein [Chloroflexota bacterium]
MNIRYLFLRVIRHFMPEKLTRFLLKRRFIIRPGLESSDPSAAVDRYVEALSQNGRTIHGKRVLVFGYGGRFAVGVGLLRRGAAHVVLCDHIESLDDERNMQLIPEYEDYLSVVDGQAVPRPEFVTLIHGDIREASIQKDIKSVDCVLSTSVYEHLGDVEGITCALAQLTGPEGFHLHFVDLRDHYFKYPFEMLKFSEKIWKTFLNPTSNLNRCRVNNYGKIFENNFRETRIEVLERDEASFAKAQSHIRAEFLSGDISVDSVTLIRVFAGKPFKK